MLRVGMPHGVQWNSWLPARKSKNMPEWVRFQFLLLPRAKTLRKSSLVGRPLIGVAGRDRDADAELLGEIEERRDVLGRMAVEYRAIDVDGKALGLGGLDGVDVALEAALHAHRLVVMVLQAVEMHREEQIGRR